MAWRSSPRAMWIWTRKSSIHTAGSVVPSYDSMFMGLNPSGNWCSITSSVKHRGCAAPLYRATSRRSSDGVHMQFLARACHARPDGRLLALGPAPLIRILIWSDRLYYSGHVVGHRCILQLLSLYLYGGVVHAGVRLELPLCPDHVVVGQVR